MNEFFSIKSERLLITSISIDELRQLVDQQDIPELRQAYQEMLDGCLRHPQQCIWYAPWNISLEENPTEIIGELGFKGPAVDGAVEIGYGLHPGYEGHGYMTEAVRAIIKWAFSLPEITTVFAETATENAASQGVLARNGFVSCGMGTEGPRFKIERAKE